MKTVSIVSLIVGLLVGYFAQRSRMCFIGGWRDYFIVRDTYLLKGFFSFFVTAALLFFIFYIAGAYMPSYPWFNRPPDMVTTYEVVGDLEEFEEYRDLDVCSMSLNPILGLDRERPVHGINIFDSFVLPYSTILLIVGAYLIGFFSTLANGCPVRQHVMAASGNISAWVYLLGFYFGIIIYEKYLAQHVLNFVKYLL